MPRRGQEFPELPPRALVTGAENPAKVISSHLRDQITSGTLQPGYRLPTLIEGASALGVEQYVMMKAYHDLTATGDATSRRKIGTFVGPNIPLTYGEAIFDVRDQIDRGELTKGMRIPSNRDMMDMYGISTKAASTAVQELEHQELVTIVPDRGVYVAEGVTPNQERSRRFQVGLGTDLTVWTNDVHGQGHTYDETISQLATEQDTDVAAVKAEMLEVPTSETFFLYNVKHHIILPGRRMSFNHITRWIPESIARGIQALDHGDSRIVESDIQDYIAEEDIFVSAVTPTRRTRMEMRIPNKKIPLIQQETVSYDDLGRPLLVTVHVFPGNRGKIVENTAAQ